MSDTTKGALMFVWAILVGVAFTAVHEAQGPVAWFGIPVSYIVAFLTGNMVLAARDLASAKWPGPTSGDWFYALNRFVIFGFVIVSAVAGLIAAADANAPAIFLGVSLGSFGYEVAFVPGVKMIREGPGGRVR